MFLTHSAHLIHNVFSTPLGPEVPFFRMWHACWVPRVHVATMYSHMLYCLNGIWIGVLHILEFRSATLRLDMYVDVQLSFVNVTSNDVLHSVHVATGLQNVHCT